jgi:hypothetical protein
MSKYVYKVLSDVVKEDWSRNTELEFPATEEQLASLSLVVIAEDEEAARLARMPVSNIMAWELVETIED